MKVFHMYDCILNVRLSSHTLVYLFRFEKRRMHAFLTINQPILVLDPARLPDKVFLKKAPSGIWNDGFRMNNRDDLVQFCTD